MLQQYLEYPRLPYLKKRRRYQLNLSSPKERNRKHALLAVVLLALLLISAGFIIYFRESLHSTSSALTEAESQSQILDYTLQQVNATAPKVTISLIFTPTPPTKNVYPDTITFITGYLTATNLTELLYPCTMIINFELSHTTTNPNATIDYSYTPYQAVYLTKGIQYVEVPMGVYPLALHNTLAGDQVTLYVTARVQIFWEPVDAIMVDQIIAGYFNIDVTEGGS